ncbi:MAG: hypothetical protein IKS83_04795 [Victivallales bacterium]|nr:hypothetical protein [Victivallales bacterium]
MIHDVYEPLERYQSEFREKFAQNTSEEFERLVRASGIDAAANAETNKNLRNARADLDKTCSRRTGWRLLGCLTWILMLAGFVAIIWPFIPKDFFSTDFWQKCIEPIQKYWYMFCAGGALFDTLGFLFFKRVVLRNLRQFRDQISHLEERISALQQEAWDQMAPLNALYDWDIAPKLIQRTVPRLEFDPYFTEGRLAELHESFGWDDSFNEDKSVLGTQSGVINGNPFVFGRFLSMQWGTTTYHGYKDISWTERVRDSKGNWTTVTRHERLHATVTKPSPVYSETCCLLYGNDAAPNLTFTRKPSGIAGRDDIIAKLKKRHEFKKLKKFSENLEDASQYTMMSNHDFEVLFHAEDRNDEIEFRLLFTPLAQTQMLKLLEDTKVGYGDDFTFLKQHKINAVFPQHLQTFSLDTNPQQFYDSDLEHARQHFQSHHEEYFKAAYFSMAPLLSIPLYQQTRTHADIYRDVLAKRSCFWEHEALANYCGEKKFTHPECVTRNILKTRIAGRDSDADGTTSLAVTAYGYKTIAHVEHVTVWGGDGHAHEVPVEWLEYLPVQRTSELLVSEQEAPPATPPDDAPYGYAARWRELLSQVGRYANPVGVRRSILAFFRN